MGGAGDARVVVADRVLAAMLQGVLVQVGADWDAELYLRFADERTRPSLDLVNRVALDNPKRCIDLGCGPGNSTELVAARPPRDG